MKRITSCLFVFLLVSAFPWISTRGVVAQNITTSEKAGLHVIETTSEGLVLQLELPEFEWVTGESDLGPCQQLLIPEWGTSGNVGEPALPIKGTLVGVPAGILPTITVLETGTVIVKENVDLCPVATPIVSEDLSGKTPDFREEMVIDSSVYSANQEFPGLLAKVGDLSMIRSQLVTQVLLQPFQYNPVKRQLTIYTTLKVQVDFGNIASQKSQSSRVEEVYFEKIIQNQIINYEAAQSWRVEPEIISTKLSDPTWPACKLTVSEDGMVQATQEALVAVCPSIVNTDPRNFQLFNGDNEVAIFVFGESDGVFGSGDKIMFYGQKTNTRFTDTNAYWLIAESDKGIRMNTADGSPKDGSVPPSFKTSDHIEENRVYLSAYPSGTDQNHWYWGLINSSTAGSYSFSLNQINSEVDFARVRGFFKGYAANPQQFTQVLVNGHIISEDFWPTRSEFTIDVQVPREYLIEGNNIIQVQTPLTAGITVNQVLVDWFEVQYSKNYAMDGTQTRYGVDSAGTWKYQVSGFSSNDLLTWDISDPLKPFFINNTLITPVAATYDLIFQQTTSSQRKYLTASTVDIPAPDEIKLVQNPDLKAITNGADYIIITHPLFSTAIQPLVTFYTNRGLRVKVVDVYDIYDEFSDGVLNPVAIRDFLAYTYTNWIRPAPAYVLLVGDGNFDFKNYSLKNDTVFIPPYLAEVDPWISETAADNRYVTVSGEDILPDMALGRLPVRTELEASAVVAKIMAHYQHSSEDWFKNNLFVAAANDPAAGNFPILSDTVINSYLPPTIQVDKVYYGSSGVTSGANARQAVADAINNGRGLVHFVGHSNQYAWFGDLNTSNPQGTIMLDKPTVELLTNIDKYPIFISMTCYTGYFVLPGFNTLDETLIRAADKGAVATWSPTGKGVATGHNLLDAGFFTAVYQDHGTTLGNATNQAKYYLYANSSGLHRELIDTYILFGDPAMLFQNTPTGVNVNYFRAEKAAAGILLSWETSEETTLGGFDLSRREVPGSFVKLNNDLISPLSGGESVGKLYSYLDTGALPGKLYEYRLDVREKSLQLLESKFLTYWPFTISLPFIQK